jgi:hypothetical protein
VKTNEWDIETKSFVRSQAVLLSPFTSPAEVMASGHSKMVENLHEKPDPSDTWSHNHACMFREYVKGSSVV